MFNENNPKTVLIIDDDPTVLDGLQAALDPKQWECRCYTSWKEAARNVPQEFNPDVAIVDLHLREDHPKNGFDAIAELTHILPELPVVALTGHADFADAAKTCLDRGAVQFCRKPALELDERLWHAIWIMKHVREEREKARGAQADLMPGEPRFEGLEIAYRFKPLDCVSGDCLDYLPIPGTQDILLAIGDARGHGYDAALRSSLVLGALRTISVAAGQDFSPARAMTAINRVIATTNDEEAYMTLFLARINIQTRAVMYARAGHPRPILLRQGQAELWKEGGEELGAKPDYVYRDWATQLEANDVLFLYTDALTDIHDRSPGADDLPLGERRLIDAVKNAAQRNGTHDLCDGVPARVLELTGNAVFDDDCTILTVTVTDG